jgi:hypothetical protein
MGNGAAPPASWRETLPEDIRSDATLGKYSDINNLARAHIELQKKFGQKGIFKPGPNASAEEIKSFRESLGIPTEVTKYDLGKFDGVEVPQPVQEWAKKVGADNGIEPAAMNKVISDWMKVDATNKATEKAQADQKTTQNLNTLKKEWGDAYDGNLKKANFAAEKMGGKDFVAALVEAGIHNDPRVIKAFVEGSKLYREDTLREGGINDGRMSPAELDGRISAVQGRLFSMSPTDGAYASVKQEYESLWKQKTGGR